jgi:hypothetical protein
LQKEGNSDFLNVFIKEESQTSIDLEKVALERSNPMAIRLIGDRHDNTFNATPANGSKTRVNGRGGNDTANFDGQESDYKVEHKGRRTIVTDAAGNKTVLKNVENLVFGKPGGVTKPPVTDPPTTPPSPPSSPSPGLEIDRGIIPTSPSTLPQSPSSAIDSYPSVSG